MVSPRPISLGPRRPNSRADLNRSLDEFYDQYAVKESAGEWFAKHTYLEAVRMWQAGKHAWMAK